jgi:phosphotransferase system HPr-like phosphotransfer protein
MKKQNVSKILASIMVILSMLFVFACSTTDNGGSSSSTPTATASSAKDITAFSFTSLSLSGTISGTDITISAPYGTTVTALVATFTTTGSSVKVGSTVQISGTTANDFTSSVTYTVTAADNSTKTYTVTVNVATGNEKEITAFSFASLSATGTISGTNIAVTVPYGTDVTSLAATFATTGSSVKIGSTVQVSGTTANDFTSPVTYTVTAINSTTQSYTVTVTIAAAPKEITAFSFASLSVTGTISGTNIAVSVPTGTDVTALAASFTTTGASVTVGVTTQVSGTTTNDFTSPVTYVVTGADGLTQSYTVTVTVATTSTVLYANFQTLPSGMSSGSETTLTSSIALPTVTNTNGYSINVVGKLKVTIDQALPSGATAGEGTTIGCVQFGNNTSSIGKVTISSVPGPFKIIINQAPSSTTDATKKLRVTIGGNEVYYFGDGTFQTVTYSYTGTDTVNIEAYGYDGTQGKGVRIFDLSIIK